jgi:hypothetical protein
VNHWLDVGSAFEMRLLSVKTDGTFSLTGFAPYNIPSYAILSHTWEAVEHEVTLQDIISGAGRGKTGFEKIKFCREQAQKDGLKYFWVDSCCIIQTHHR